MHFDTEQLNIRRANGGFYEGFNKVVTIGTKLIIAALVIWAAVFSESAGRILEELKLWSFSVFGGWYIYSMAFFLITCLSLAIFPATGTIKLGRPDDKPEFSTFSWIAMMFGAGVGIGMLTFSTAEPLYHYVANPDTIMGLAVGETAENVRIAYKWSFFHWGLSAWGCYALVGMSLAYFSYNQGHPLTIRSALVSLFGKKLDGVLGHIVDISAVVATILGASVTIGFGISQFAAGAYEVSGAAWIINADSSPSITSMLVALVIITGVSTLSAISGVGRGIKWLSNINMWLSIALLSLFLILGATTTLLQSLFLGIWDYLLNLPQLAFTYWAHDNTEPGASLYAWQSISWTVFYWAWWIAFAPFVGVFLARISRGRTIREFVLGAMLVPSLVCFVWFTFVGGTAIDLELNGGAASSILNAGQESQLYATLKVMLSGKIYTMVTALVVVLLLTYLVTSADSAVLIINTINSGGDADQKHWGHTIIWGGSLALVVGTLLLAGGMEALRASMFVGALPFSLIMVLMGISLIKALIESLIKVRHENPEE